MKYKNIKIHLIVLLCVLVFCIKYEQSVVAAPNNQAQVEQKRAQAKQQIHKLKLLEKLETNKLYKNQKKLERNEMTLIQNKQEYEQSRRDLLSMQAQYEQIRDTYMAQVHATNIRINQIYKSKRMNYVEFLMSASDLNNFLDRIYFENIVMTMDKQKIAQTQEKTRKLRNLTQEIENKKRYLKSSIDNMSRQQQNIQSAISKNEQMIYKLKTDRATWEKAEKDLARQSKAIEEMIVKTTGSSSTKTVITTTGGFVRPVPGPVTSPFGNRMHPIFKRQIFHSGVDLGSPYGTAVKAANSGKVIFVGWYGGYGKVVILDHGKVNGAPTTTLYAHLSSYRVDKGDSIYRGQVIANVGSTGYSTGPHLHFEVRKNGAPTNPFNYIPR